MLVFPFALEIQTNGSCFIFCAVALSAGRGRQFKGSGVREVKLYIHKDCCNAEHYKFSGGLKKECKYAINAEFYGWS